MSMEGRNRLDFGFAGVVPFEVEHGCQDVTSCPVH